MLLASLILLASAHADPTPAYHTTKALRVGPSYQGMTRTPFAGVSSLGSGISSIYEIVISPASSLGINLAFRYFPGETAGAPSLSQLGYGLMMKHYVAQWTSIQPFFEYGLLLHLSWVSDRPSSGTAHDTLLGAGTDFRLGGIPLFVAASYHFSTLKLFESPSYSLDRIQTELGVRFSW